MGVPMHLNIRLARGVRSTPSGGFRRPRSVSDIHHDRHGGGDADCGAERGPNAESPFDLQPPPERVQTVSMLANPAPRVTAVTSNPRPSWTTSRASSLRLSTIPRGTFDAFARM
jgi:hypothetical protein